MRSETLPFSWFEGRFFTDLEPVQSFGLWRVWSARQSHLPLLLVVNEEEAVVLRCEYESLTERAGDIALVRRLGGEGGEGAGVLAAGGPVPPGLSAGAARALPESD